jgi:PncC family amidohydrolase
MPVEPALKRSAGRVHAAFLRTGRTLALAESCTGGLIAEAITDFPGSSAYFWGGAVVYSNESKSALALVPADLIASRGAVSRETAVALAEGILKRSGADLACAVSGIAGPSGGTALKPVGTVHIAVISKGGSPREERFSFKGGRSRVRTRAAMAALSMLEAELARFPRLDNHSGG